MSSPVSLDGKDTGIKNQWSGVVHCHFDGCPRATAVSRECRGQMRFLAITLCDGATHGETPDDRLSRCSIQYRVRVGELQIPLPPCVVKDGDRFFPSVTVISRKRDENVAHVFLAIHHRPEGNKEMFGFVGLDNEWLPDPPGLGMLLDSADDPYVGDITFIRRILTS